MNKLYILLRQQQELFAKAREAAVIQEHAFIDIKYRLYRLFDD